MTAEEDTPFVIQTVGFDLDGDFASDCDDDKNPFSSITAPCVWQDLEAHGHGCVSSTSSSWLHIYDVCNSDFVFWLSSFMRPTGLVVTRRNGRPDTGEDFSFALTSVDERKIQVKGAVPELLLIFDCKEVKT